MTRRLLPVDAADPAAVAAALGPALTADGPAVLPYPPGVPPLDAPDTVPQRIAVVIETSGSSGRPKRVALAADALLAGAAASDAVLGGPGQWLLALPAHYIAGLNVLVRSLIAQTSPVVLGAGHFDAAAFVADASGMDGDRRYTSLVPVQLARLVELAAQDRAAADVLRSFDRILVGGQSIPPELVARASELGLRVTRTYGSSETAGGCVYDGVPIGGAHAAEVDGQLELSGPVLAEGYLDDPERTAAAFVTRDGVRWYRTGDTGRVRDGVVTVDGRLDRVIVSGGVKISLDAVERVVRRTPGLADAVVLPVVHPTWGEASIVVATTDVGLADIRRRVIGELGREAAPDRIAVVDAIPMLASGKPDLVTLRARFGSPT